MKNNSTTEQINQQIKEEIKIGNTVFIINQIFVPKQTKQEAWLSIITRAESLKTGQ